MSLTVSIIVRCDKYSCKEAAAAEAALTFDERKIPVFKVKLPLGWQEKEMFRGEDPEYRCPGHADPGI